ncbi:EAL domain-containing protein [Qipengyuania sp. GPGPB31]|uniref:EAL domain-containing protein n=1 Tax=Qipengyuania sp. GPGPB31 TaxID=3023518 RepID=UPI003134459D
MLKPEPSSRSQSAQVYRLTDRIASVEALVRWHHPTRGYLSPDSFIPLAEKNDHIADMTLFVLQRTLWDLAQWHAAGIEVKAAVNISARLLISPAFFEAVGAALQRGGTSASDLIFEVTESATMADPAAALRALEGYRRMGIMISLDDYGTGQSTLTYLKTLPLGELKIDRSFVENAHEDSSDALLVRSTVNLAHALGLQVVAEGIETVECLDFLREVGCDLAQGYFVSRPLPASELLAFCLSSSTASDTLARTAA